MDDTFDITFTAYGHWIGIAPAFRSVADDIEQALARWGPHMLSIKMVDLPAHGVLTITKREKPISLKPTTIGGSGS